MSHPAKVVLPALLVAGNVLATGVPSSFAAPIHEVAAEISSTSLIVTIAGTGLAGADGDEGPARLALLTQPRDTAIAPDGSIAVADTRNNRIREIAPDGTISTIAGNGIGGFGGDGGPAVDAQLMWPHDVAYDDAGNLYIADSNNHRIRKVDTKGIITTVAGTGEVGYNGDLQPALDADLKYPKSVAVYDDFLYFADSLSHRIRRVNLDTHLIRTVAGSGAKGYAGDGGPAVDAALDTPQRIALDSAGNLYIADTKNSRIRRVSAQTQRITTVVGTGEPTYTGDGGPAASATVSLPRGIALSDDATLFVADSGNHVIRRVNLDSGIIRTMVGTGEMGYAGDGGPAGEATLFGPRGLTVDSEGQLLIADTLNNVVRMVVL